MNISNQPLGRVLVWGLAFVRVPTKTKQDSLLTDTHISSSPYLTVL